MLRVALLPPIRESVEARIRHVQAPVGTFTLVRHLVLDEVPGTQGFRLRPALVHFRYVARAP